MRESPAALAADSRPPDNPGCASTSLGCSASLPPPCLPKGRRATCERGRGDRRKGRCTGGERLLGGSGEQPGELLEEGRESRWPGGGGGGGGGGSGDGGESMALRSEEDGLGQPPP